MKLSEYDKTHGTQLEQQVDYVRRRAKELKAYRGEQRLSIVAEHFSNLSLEQAYTMLSPEAFKNEVEEAQGYKKQAKFFQFGRSVLGLAPLIVTWGSISWAVLEYGNYVNLHHQDQSPLPSFLQQWQQGFPSDPLTFFLTGVFDVMLLLMFLSFTIFSLSYEYHSHSKSDEFARELQYVTDGLLQAVAKVGRNDVASDTEINRIMKYIKMAIAESYQDLEGIIQDARDTIVQAGQNLQNMFQSQVSPLLTNFNTGVTNFHQDLGALNTQVLDLAQASTKMATSSNDLAASAASLKTSVQAQATVVQDIDRHLVALNSTEQGVIQGIQQIENSTVGEMRQVASSIDGAARSIQASSQGVVAATTKVEDVGKQLVMIDPRTLATITNEVSRVVYEAGAVANTLKQVSMNLDAAAQEFKKAAKGVRRRFPWF